MTFGRSLYHKRGALANEIKVFVKHTSQSSAFFFVLQTSTKSQQGNSLQTLSAEALILDFPTSINMSNQTVLYNFVLSQILLHNSTKVQAACINFQSTYSVTSLTTNS